MDKYAARVRIKNVLSGVLFHEEVIDEIFELVIGSGIEEQFFKKFVNNIGMLKNLGLNVTQTKNFEKLKNVDDLYSMKFKGKNMNLRLLYSYDIQSSAIMLHCFYEKNDSKHGNYSSHIPIALKRKQEMEKRHEK